MTVEMVLRGEQIPYHYYTDDNPDAEFDDVDGADVAEAFETWRSECADASERAAAAPSLDITGPQDGKEFSGSGSDRGGSTHRVLVCLTGCHARCK